MEGQIPENWIPLFKPQLKEEFVYYIKFFQVRNARATYCPVDHPYMMRFTAHTKVHEVKDFLIVLTQHTKDNLPINQQAKNKDFTPLKIPLLSQHQVILGLLHLNAARYARNTQRLPACSTKNNKHTNW